MNFVDEFKSLLLREGAAPGTVEKLLGVAMTGLHVEKKFTTELVQQAPLLGIFKRKPRQVRHGLPTVLGGSKIGGIPDVPQGFNWPQHQGRPATFLTQVNCAEIARWSEHTLLPSHGVLHIFYDLSFADPDQASRLVCYSPDSSDLKPAQVPSDRSQSMRILPAFPVNFVPIPTFPSGLSAEFDRLNLDEEATEHFFEAHAKWQSQCLHSQTPEWGGLHQIGGHPNSIQDDVRCEFEMHAKGHTGSTDKHLWEQARQSAAKWRILLQFDTDDDLGIMFGDAGMVYFGIHEDDLRASKFERTKAIEQFY